MALANYTDLKASIASWLMRDDLTANIPDFIALCESTINLKVRTRQMESSTTLTPATGGICTLPTDYIEARRVVSNVDPISVLEPIGMDAARQQYSTAGYPFFYAIQGSSLLVFPPSTSTVTLDYYATVPALATASTNWLLTKAPRIYLYGTLMEAAPFLEDDSRLVTWAQLLQAAIDDLHKADFRAVYSKAVARIRGVTP